MSEVILSTAMSQAMQLGVFWTAVVSHACPATQLALVGTARLARDAVLQCAPGIKQTLQLSPTPSPDKLGQLRNSGRTLPATVAIHNNTDHPSPPGAKYLTRLNMQQLSCPAVTSLQLGGGPWLVDTALVACIHAALPVLTKLVLSNVTTPTHLPAAPAAPALAWPSLRTVSISFSSNIPGPQKPAIMAHLTAVLAGASLQAGA